MTKRTPGRHRAPSRLNNLHKTTGVFAAGTGLVAAGFTTAHAAPQDGIQNANFQPAPANVPTAAALRTVVADSAATATVASEAAAFAATPAKAAAASKQAPQAKYGETLSWTGTTPEPEPEPAPEPEPQAEEQSAEQATQQESRSEQQTASRSGSRTSTQERSQSSGGSSSNSGDSDSGSNGSGGSDSGSKDSGSKDSGGSGGGSASGIIGTVQKYLGVPYVWGGSTPSGFDCSGLVQYVFAQNGISLPRMVGGQRAASTPVSNPRPGDLVFYGTYHVGIYAGNGMMYDAPKPGKSVTLRPLFRDTPVSMYGRVG